MAGKQPLFGPSVAGWLAGLRLINVGARRRSNRAILRPGASPVAAPASVSNHVPHVFRVIPSMAGLLPVQHGFVLVRWVSITCWAIGLFVQGDDGSIKSRLLGPLRAYMTIYARPIYPGPLNTTSEFQ